MSSIAITGGATGTGVFSLLAPSTSTNRTLTLPDSTGTVATNEAIAAAGYTTSAGVLTQFNASGSAPVYACRAWVNFNGTGTPAIRGSGNVSSITDNGTGDYTVNFTVSMPDANYAVMTGPSIRASSDRNSMPTFYTAGAAATTSSFRIRNSNITEAAVMHDAEIFYLSIFR